MPTVMPSGFMFSGGAMLGMVSKTKNPAPAKIIKRLRRKRNTLEWLMLAPIQM